MPHHDIAARLQLLTGNAEIAAAVAEGIAEHGIAFSVFVSTVATISELAPSAVVRSFRDRYLGSFTDVTHAHRFFVGQYREAAVLAGHTHPSDTQLQRALALLQVVETEGIAYVFARPLSAFTQTDPPDP